MLKKFLLKKRFKRIEEDQYLEEMKSEVEENIAMIKSLVKFRINERERSYNGRIYFIISRDGKVVTELGGFYLDVYDVLAKDMVVLLRYVAEHIEHEYYERVR